MNDQELNQAFADAERRRQERLMSHYMAPPRPQTPTMDEVLKGLLEFAPVTGEVMSGMEAFEKGNQAAEAYRAGDKLKASDLRVDADLAALGAVPILGTIGRVARKTPEYFLRSVEAIKKLGKQKAEVPAKELFATFQREGVRGSELVDTNLASTRPDWSPLVSIDDPAVRLTEPLGNGDSLIERIEANAPRLRAEEFSGVRLPNGSRPNPYEPPTYYGNQQMPEYGAESRETLFYPGGETLNRKPLDYQAPHFGHRGEGLGFHTRTKVIQDSNGDEGLMIGEIQGDAYSENRRIAEQYKEVQQEINRIKNEMEKAKDPTYKWHEFDNEEHMQRMISNLEEELGRRQQPMDLPFGQEDWIRVATGQSIGQAYRDGLNHVYIPTVDTAVKYHHMSPEKAKVVYERNALSAAKRFATEYGAKLEQASAGGNPGRKISASSHFAWWFGLDDEQIPIELRTIIDTATEVPSRELRDTLSDSFLPQLNELRVQRGLAPWDKNNFSGAMILGLRHKDDLVDVDPGDGYWKLSFTPKTLQLIESKGLPYYLSAAGLSAVGASAGLGSSEAVAAEKERQIESDDPEELLR